MIYLVATIELKDAKFREDFLKILNANVPKVRAEEGCKLYQPMIDFASGLSAQKRVADNIVTILEGWESMERLMAHLKAPHMAEYREKARPYVNPTVLNVMEPAQGQLLRRPRNTIKKGGLAMGAILYPGSFDPITNGHLDIIRRASRLFDSIIVGVASNAEKQPLFTVEERMELLREACAGYPHISVACFDGLLVDALEKLGAEGVIRGLRAVSDFEYEFQMALMNRELNPKYETLFLMPSPEYSFVSSRMIKEIARFGGDIKPFVPPPVLDAINRKFGRI